MHAHMVLEVVKRSKTINMHSIGHESHNCSCRCVKEHEGVFHAFASGCFKCGQVGSLQPGL